MHGEGLFRDFIQLKLKNEEALPHLCVYAAPVVG